MKKVLFIVVVILLLITYVLLVYRFRSDIVQLFTNRKAIADEIITTGQGSIYGRFFSTTVGVGLLMVAIMVVKGADLAPALSSGVVAPQWIYAVAVPSVLMATIVITSLQVALLWVIGGVAMCSDVTSAVIHTTQGQSIPGDGNSVRGRFRSPIRPKVSGP